MIEFTEITDFNAPELDVYARLTEAQLLNRFEPKKGMFIAESPKVICRALDAGCRPVSLLVERSHCNEEAQAAIARCGDVPVYTADVVKKVLPNRAATAHKPYEEWKVMEDKDFLFSLYSRDLVHIKSKKSIKTSDNEPEIHDIYTYYIGADISTASIQGIAHDSRYKFRSLGIQSLDVFEKCQVNILGHISTVKSEKRMGFS